MKNLEVRIYSPQNLSERWYVYIYDPAIQKTIKKIYKGINKEFDFESRMLRCEVLRDSLVSELKSGWNPIGIPTKVSEQYFYAEALEYGLEKKRPTLAKDSLKDYGCTVRFFQEAINDLNFNRLLISRCERYHIKAVMDHLQIKKKWTAKNFNKHLGYMSSIFSELVEWELIKTNPIRDIRAQKEIKTEGYIQPTLLERKKIFDYLKAVDYNYYIFASIEYYLGIRPKEILLIKCGDVDLENKTIKILPEDSKDNSYRYVPILNPMLELLNKLDLSNKDYYLIGRPKPYGCRFFKHEYFCPNPYPIKRDTATRKWKEYIIDGLGINVKCYSLKHSGANAKLVAGMDIKTISEIFGHSDEKITEIYANYINNIRFKEAQNIKLEEY